MDHELQQPVAQPNTLVIISGPTASGKTAVAIEVAKYFNTVILSADSRQCYKELNIGVARPAVAELEAVPHYFIATHSIQQELNAALYEAYALDLLQDLFKKHETVVVAGGTGLYIKALLEGLDDMPAVPPAIRQEIIDHYHLNGLQWLKEQLQLKDPQFAAEGEMHNPQRMMRALEVMQATGASIISFRKKKKPVRNFHWLHISLQLPRTLLYGNINGRVDQMMATGLEEEARALWPLRHLNALQTVGYQELFQYFEGNISREKAVELIKQNTRHYAKRQITWFKKQPGIKWLNSDEIPTVIPFICQHLAKP